MPLNPTLSKRKTPSPESLQSPRICLAVSRCLLGERVRFDGGHKRDAYVTEVLANHFDLVPVCPEVAIGMGVPREPIHLVKTKRGLRAIGVQHRDLDVTDKLREYGKAMAKALSDIDGYIFKKNSPSCGVEGVRLYGIGEIPFAAGVGIYAQAFMSQRSWLPVVEEGHLSDPVLRENFLERVLVHYRWRQMSAKEITPAALVEFHTCHKFTVMAHSQPPYRRLGRLVAEAGSQPIEALAATYMAELMATLKQPATRRGHTNVLMHLLGFLHSKIDKEDRAELLELIESYRRGLVSLIIPITLLNHYFRHHPNSYVSKQHYLNLYPPELMLRNLI